MNNVPKFELVTGCSVGTHLIGHVTATYPELVHYFGEPNGGSDNYKVAFEWVIRFEDGTVATIYDYKETNLYNSNLPSPEELKTNGFNDWHVGGREARAEDYVKTVVTQGTYVAKPVVPNPSSVSGIDLLTQAIDALRNEALEEVHVKIANLQRDIDGLIQVNKDLAAQNNKLLGQQAELLVFRAKADAYDRVCQSLGITNDILGYVHGLKRKVNPEVTI